MKTLKLILGVIYLISLFMWPISFVLTFIGLFMLNAKLMAFSFFILCFTTVYCFAYISDDKVFRI